MTHKTSVQHAGTKLGMLASAIAMALLLAGCLLSPGKFTSQLNLHKDGSFAYAYDGEIYLLALGKLAEMGNKSKESTLIFEPQSCRAEDSFEERPCTAEELAQQKGDWNAEAKRKASSKKEEAEMMRGMLGGIDPADPKAAEELADRLRRQDGWKSVEYKGDGLFVVSFAISGRLDHDFLFPTIERFPMSNFFVQVTARKEGNVRVDAAGFSAQSSASPMAGMMAGLAAAGSNKDGQQAPALPKLDGVFRIVTDGAVLANNTDEGPSPSADGTVLQWSVSPTTQAAPMALIKLAD